MKVKCFTTVTVTSMVEIEVDDDAPQHKIEYEANTARHLHGQTVIEDTENHWYVQEHEEEAPKFGNPHNM